MCNIRYMGDVKPIKPTEPDGIPQHLLNEINEHAVGGFALFYFHPEHGFPQHQLFFDSPAHCLAMQKYMTDWCNALQAIYLEGTKANIRQSFTKHDMEERPDDDEDGE